MSGEAAELTARGERVWAFFDLCGALVALGICAGFDWLLWQLALTDAGVLSGGVQLDMLLFLTIFVHVVALVGLLTLAALGAVGYAGWRLFSR